MTADRTRRVGAREDVISEGEPIRAINLVEDGWAYRYRMLIDGRRQIVSLFLPGDICDLNLFVIQRTDHSIGAITDLRICEISQAGFDALMGGHPRLRQALWWVQLVASSVQREWTLNMGQRTAYERLAHFFCEIYLRLDTVGLAQHGSCELPLTQTDIGEITGLSSVHVNRTLQELRAVGLVIFRDKRLTIPDFPALAETGLFDPSYLHLGHIGKHLDANHAG